MLLTVSAKNRSHTVERMNLGRNLVLVGSKAMGVLGTLESTSSVFLWERAFFTELSEQRIHPIKTGIQLKLKSPLLRKSTN